MRRCGRLVAEEWAGDSERDVRGFGGILSLK